MDGFVPRLEALEGRLHELHISMNASNEEDYNQIIANGSWSLFAVATFEQRALDALAVIEFVKAVAAFVAEPALIDFRIAPRLQAKERAVAVIKAHIAAGGTAAAD